MEAVAAASDRVSLGTYGKTNEGRDLLLLTITSPANHARIAEIQSNMARLADPRGADQADSGRGSSRKALLLPGSRTACTEVSLQGPRRPFSRCISSPPERTP